MNDFFCLYKVLIHSVLFIFRQYYNEEITMPSKYQAIDKTPAQDDSNLSSYSSLVLIVLFKIFTFLFLLFQYSLIDYDTTERGNEFVCEEETSLGLLQDIPRPHCKSY